MWIVLLLVAAVGGGGFLAVGWIFSQRILEPLPYQLFPEFDIVAVETAQDGSIAVTLPAPGARTIQFARTDAEGRYGLLWEAGAGEVGAPVVQADGTIVRALTVTTGAAPAAGAPARIDATVFRPDPSVHGLDFDDVRIPTEVGDVPAWWIEGDARVAVLMIHGRRRADRTEMLRALPTVAAGGASVLVTSYRNHDTSPPSPDGFFHYGASEVDDVLAAVRWLQARGIERVVTFGSSMGGAISIGLHDRWPVDGPRLLGMVLDAPMIDPEPVFALGAANMGLPVPEFLAFAATRVARLRTGVAFGRLDLRRSADSISVPVLTFASEGDYTIPVGIVDTFMAGVQAPKRYVRLGMEVDHVEAWNADPAAYESELAAFLMDLGAAPGAVVAVR